MASVFTIGHSNHAIADFLKLLRQHVAHGRHVHAEAACASVVAWFTGKDRASILS